MSLIEPNTSKTTGVGSEHGATEIKASISPYQRINSLLTLIDENPSLLPNLREILLESKFYLILAPSPGNAPHLCNLTRQYIETSKIANKSAPLLCLSLFQLENDAQNFSNQIQDLDSARIQLLPLVNVAHSLTDSNDDFTFLFQLENKNVFIPNKIIQSILFGKIASPEERINIDLLQASALEFGLGKDQFRDMEKFCGELHRRLSRETKITAAYLGKIIHQKNGGEVLALFICSNEKEFTSTLFADLDFIIKRLPPGSNFDNNLICHISDKEVETLTRRDLKRIF